MREILLIIGRVGLSIIREWWIVCLFLISIELALSSWILFLVGIFPQTSILLTIFFAGLAVAIPLREAYWVNDPSVMQRFKDKFVGFSEERNSELERESSVN